MVDPDAHQMLHIVHCSGDWRGHISTLRNYSYLPTYNAMIPSVKSTGHRVRGTHPCVAQAATFNCASHEYGGGEGAVRIRCWLLAIALQL